jgi:hypothetical protein
MALTESLKPFIAFRKTGEIDKYFALRILSVYYNLFQAPFLPACEYYSDDQLAEYLEKAIIAFGKLEKEYF